MLTYLGNVYVYIYNIYNIIVYNLSSIYRSQRKRKEKGVWREEMEVRII